MRVWRLGWLVLAVLPAGCGGDKPPATLTVTCGDSIALVGARSIDVLGDQVNGHTMINFPDPVNRGKTGTLSVAPGDRCTITPAIGSGG